MDSTFFSRSGLAIGALILGAAGPLDVAQASGPVERLLQVLTHPTDPNVLVVRYGVASEGLLFSRDGGRTFRALCTQAIAPEVDRISPGGSYYSSPVIMDSTGKLLINTFDALWSDDGTGCSWAKQPGVDGKWLVNLKVDPSKPQEVLALANTSTGDGDDLEARTEILRRDASGAWTTVGTVRRPVARQRAYGGDLLAVKTATGTRLYVSLTSSIGPLTAPQTTSVATSDDGGKTWRESRALPASQEYLTLLGADPLQPDRVLAVVPSDGPDALFLSEDQGKTFKSYGTVQEASGVTFMPDGRVFVGDAGGNGRDGGVFTAARLGQPLTRVPSPAVMESPNVDCVNYDARTSKLRVCKLNRFGELNHQTGEFTELVQIETVAGLLECAGRDIRATCEAQLNAGPAWCCTGHYPFTPFCGEYDITSMRGRRVACGLAGRAADIEAGRGPSTNAGAAKPDAGAAMTTLPSLYSVDEDEQASPSAVSGGCSAAGGPGAGAGLSALLGLLTLAAMRLVRRRSAVSNPRS